MTLPVGLRRELYLVSGDKLLFAATNSHTGSFQVSVLTGAAASRRQREGAVFLGTATISRRGHVAIPARVRSALRIEAGDRLAFVKDSNIAGVFEVSVADTIFRSESPSLDVSGLLQDCQIPDTGSESRADAVANLLRSTELFKELRFPDLTRIASLLIERTYNKGEILMSAGKPCQGLFIVASGFVKLFRTAVDGKEQIIHVVRPGEVLNSLAVLDGGPCHASAQALENVCLYFLARPDFERLLAQHQAMSRALLLILVRGFRQLIDLVEDLSTRQVTSRVARLFLDGKTPCENLSQRDLAAMVGTVREVMARALHQLERQGGLSRRTGAIKVRDAAVLRRYL